MFVSVYDNHRIINVSLHVGEPMTDADIDRAVAAIDAMADALASKRAEFATWISIVEADSGPTAKQRKRIGEASKKLTRCYQVVVTQSAAVRAAATAVRWFTLENANHRHEAFATWPEARAWLVQQTRHSAEALDVLYADTRARVAAHR